MSAPVWRNRIVSYDTKPANQFAPNPLNWRTHPNVQREALRGLLGDVGWVGAVLENKQTGNLVDGHARIEEALSEDSTQLIPYLLVDLTPEEEKLVLASFDPISALATADSKRLEELLKDVSSSSQAVDSMLAELAKEHGVFTADEPKDAEPQIDKAEELQQKWGTETGQLWVIGNHRLLVGDATNKADVGRLCGNERADVVYADPPYGYDKDIQNDETVEQALLVYSGALQQAQVATDAWAIVDTPKKYLSRFIKATEGAGWFTREPVLHMYRNSMANGPYGTNVFELSMVYSQGKPKVNHRHLNAVDVARKGGSDNEHPTQKFAESYAHFIKLFAGSSALIYDPFFGSGTAFIACENTGRTCYGMELEAKFCAVTLERMTTAFPHLKIEKVDQARAA